MQPFIYGLETFSQSGVPVIHLLIIVALAGASTSIWWGVVVWSRCIAQDAKDSAERIDAFYHAAQVLLKNPATPTSVVTFINFFAERVGRPALVRSFAMHLIRGGPRATKSAHSRQFEADLRKLNDSQKRAFIELMVNGMVSSAASDPIFSRVYLMIVTSWFSTTGRRDGQPSLERANTAAIDIAQNEPCDDMVPA